MIKRVVLICFVAVLIFFGVFCSKKNLAVKNEKKKFVFWSIQLKPIFEKQINEIIKDFETKHPQYRVVWVDIPIQEAQKRTLASALSSTPADLINLNPDFSILLAKKNALEYFSDEDTAQFHKPLVEKLKYKDKIYALPFYATSPVTIYNRETFNKCAIEASIKTYDDLYKISPELFSCSKKSVFASSLNENDTLVKILNKYGVKSASDEEKALKIYLMLDDMYKKSYLPSDILTINHRETVEKYMSDKVSIIVTGSNFVDMIKQNAPDIYKKSDISPQLTSQAGGYDVAIMNLIIPKKSKNKELALEFALNLTNEKNQLELAKLTNVLPANKYALNNDYFKNCSGDLTQEARCICAGQLENLSGDFSQSNKKEINEAVNRALEEIFLNKNSCFEFIKSRVHNLFLQLNFLIED